MRETRATSSTRPFDSGRVCQSAVLVAGWIGAPVQALGSCLHLGSGSGREICASSARALDPFPVVWKCFTRVLAVDEDIRYSRRRALLVVGPLAQFPPRLQFAPLDSPSPLDTHSLIHPSTLPSTTHPYFTDTDWPTDGLTGQCAQCNHPVMRARHRCMRSPCSGVWAPRRQPARLHSTPIPPRHGNVRRKRHRTMLSSRGLAAFG